MGVELALRPDSLADGLAPEMELGLEFEKSQTTLCLVHCQHDGLASSHYQIQCQIKRASASLRGLVMTLGESHIRGG